MPTPIAPAPLPGDVSLEALLRSVLDVSLTGIILFRPAYNEVADTLLDFTYDYLNPAAQQMLALPQCPTESFLTLFPMADAVGIFAFYREAFLSGQSQRQEFNFQHDGLDGYYHLAAQRQGPLLVVSFTDTNDQPRSAVEVALRESQAREQVALARAEAERQQLYQILQQLPAQVATYSGPTHVFTFVNPRFETFVPAQGLLGRPVRQAAAGVVGEEVFSLLDRVYTTGEIVQAHELAVQLPAPASGAATPLFINVSYHPLRDMQGRIHGVLDYSYDVTEQVLARRQVQRLNEELAASNEELRATNEEYERANTALSETQQQLRQLNQALDSARAGAERERAQLQAFLEQAPVLLALFEGEDLRVALANTSITNLWGYARADVLGRPLLEGVPELQGQGFDDLLRQVLLTQVPVTGTETPAVLQRNGQLHTVYFNFVYQPLYEADGQVAGVLCVAVDVTEQVLARQQVEQLNRELEARVLERTQAAELAQVAAERERNLLQAVLIQAPVAIGLFQGEELRITAANAQMAALWGRTPEQVIGLPFMDAVPELRGQGFDEQMRQVLRTQVSVHGSETPATMLRDGHLQTTYYDFVYQALYDADGHVIGAIDVAVEVTQQVLARQQVQTLNEELTAANEELRVSNVQLTRTNVDLDTFVYTASHDLKAPITNIEGLLNALRYHLPAQVQEEELTSQLLAMMQGAVERFRYTIGQLTDISRLQQAQNQPAERVQVAAVVEDVRLDLLPLLTSTKARLLVEVEADVHVRFSPKNLRSVVYNLLSNALKYHQPGQPPVVLLRAIEVSTQVVLTVTDKGLGLSEAQQARLFELFQRLHTHVEGTGVGLYMVKRILDNAGATITVQSQPGQGTMFRVTFPAPRT